MALIFTVENGIEIEIEIEINSNVNDPFVDEILIEKNFFQNKCVSK